MHSTRGRARLAVTVTALLVALATAGCGRQVEPTAAGPTAPPVSPATTVAPMTSAPADPPAAGPAVPSPSGPATSLPTDPAVTTAAGTPLPTPDLTSIEDLLNQLDNDLDADASAGTSEGSPQ